MTGAFVHERILLPPIATHFQQLGAQVWRQHCVRLEDSLGFADLFIIHGMHRIICEAELTSDRVLNDVCKAKALQAALLMIVVPHQRVAVAIRRRLAAAPSTAPGVEKWVLPLGPMLQRVRNRFPLFSNVMSPRTTNIKPPGSEPLA